MKQRPLPIPAALLALLRQVWKADTAYQAWDDAWSEDDKERQRDPSFYFLRANAPPYSMQPLSRAEGEALLACGLLVGLARHSGEALAVNEHAAHAIQDFAMETYAAWAKLRERLATARAADRTGEAP